MTGLLDVGNLKERWTCPCLGLKCRACCEMSQNESVINGKTTTFMKMLKLNLLMVQVIAHVWSYRSLK
jgi:hypothetical protein